MIVVVIAVALQCNVLGYCMLYLRYSEVMKSLAIFRYIEITLTTYFLLK